MDQREAERKFNEIKQKHLTFQAKVAIGLSKTPQGVIEAKKLLKEIIDFLKYNKAYLSKKDSANLIIMRNQWLKILEPYQSL